jgi:hypothetical protein
VFSPFVHHRLGAFDASSKPRRYLTDLRSIRPPLQRRSALTNREILQSQITPL